METKKKPFERSIETQMILGKLREFLRAPRPAVIPYQLLSEYVGERVDGSYSPLQSARRILETEDSVNTCCDPGRGVVILGAEGGLLLLEREGRSIQHKARRSRKIADRIEGDGLSQEKVTRLLVRKSFSLLVEMAGKERKLERIAKQVEKKQAALDYSEMVDTLRMIPV